MEAKHGQKGLIALATALGAACGFGLAAFSMSESKRFLRTRHFLRQVLDAASQASRESAQPFPATDHE